MMRALVHGRVIVPDAAGDFRVLPDAAVLYDGRIRRILPMGAWQDGEAEEILDVAGRYVAPGFLNVHVHGCAGADTMDEEPGALAHMRQFQASTGVTAFLPTTMTYGLPRIRRALERIRSEMGRDGGAQVLGCHMEGPYISPARKGAQAAEHIRKADFADIEGYLDVIRILTLAPEELPDGSFVRQCREAGIRLSIGHTSAGYEEAKRAVEELGIRRFTHVFQAMGGFHHREPGTLGAALDTDAACELIADNVHSHPMAHRLLLRMKGLRRIMLVTDSLRAAGMGDGPSELGGQQVQVKGGRATLADGTIAASVLTMDRAVANFRENTGITVPQAVELATRVPAEDLGLYGERGSISPGKRADFAVFDDSIRIHATIVGGVTQFRPKG